MATQKFKPIPAFTEKMKARFWAKVSIREDDMCWPWKAATNKGTGANEYGRLGTHAEGGFIAPRVAYFLHYGTDPGTKRVCHICDMPICCNPLHFFLSDQIGNMQDMMSKGRGNHVRGDGVHTAKLTWEEVREIRRVYVKNSPINLVSLGRKYGVTPAVVHKIITHATWREV